VIYQHKTSKIFDSKTTIKSIITSFYKFIGNNANDDLLVQMVLRRFGYFSQIPFDQPNSIFLLLCLLFTQGCSGGLLLHHLYSLFGLADLRRTAGTG